jgi:hypothetical protein
MDMGDFIGFNDPLWGEYKFLDDVAPVGSNWKSPAYNGLVTIAGLTTEPMTVRFSTTILQKLSNISMVLSAVNVTYNDVIVVEEKYERFLAGNWVDITSQVGSFRKYYAKNTGLVKYEALNGAGTVSANFQLKAFTVY